MYTQSSSSKIQVANQFECTQILNNDFTQEINPFTSVPLLNFEANQAQERNTNLLNKRDRFEDLENHKFGIQNVFNLNQNYKNGEHSMKFMVNLRRQTKKIKMRQKRSELDAKMHRRMRNNEVQSSISLPLTERFQNIDQLDQNQSEFQAKTESQCYNQLNFDNQSLKGQIEILYSTFQNLQKGENVGDTFAQNLKIIKHMLGKLDQLSLDYSYQNGLIDIIVTVIRNELHNRQPIESDLTFCIVYKH